jgi:hypothetical protein
LAALLILILLAVAFPTIGRIVGSMVFWAIVAAGIFALVGAISNVTMHLTIWRS